MTYFVYVCDKMTNYASRTQKSGKRTRQKEQNFISVLQLALALMFPLRIKLESKKDTSFKNQIQIN